jgi:hypothetical protein
MFTGGFEQSYAQPRSHMLRRTALVLLALLNTKPTLGQSALIDWSHVSVDASGEAATFGPRVAVPEESLPIHASLDDQGVLGYFANNDGFYGRPDHTEYQLVRRGSNGRLEALKVVGDANVPRECFSPTPLAFYAAFPGFRHHFSLTHASTEPPHGFRLQRAEWCPRTPNRGQTHMANCRRGP